MVFFPHQEEDYKGSEDMSLNYDQEGTAEISPMMRDQLLVPEENSKKARPQEKNNIFCIQIKRPVHQK